ncbi:MAG: phage holin family protein [Coriobacteriia bacterium]|jgi:putative membrane protein|nr:phage holin family protein [Coriobacteriia bacterium]
MRIVLHWIITAIALVAAVFIVPGITVEGNAYVAIAVTAALLGLINAYLRPVLQFAACGCIILTLGLALPVINALTLWMAAYVSSQWFGLGFVVDGFWPAFWGGIIVSAVSFILYALAPPEDPPPSQTIITHTHWQG